MHKSQPKGMVTVRPIRTGGHKIWLGCGPCNAGRYFEIGDICRAFDDWTVEELHRAGHFLCEGCGQPPVLFIYRPGFNTFQEVVERWPEIRLRVA